MNKAGARRVILFSVDFELSEGFFVSDPLDSKILFEPGVTN